MGLSSSAAAERVFSNSFTEQQMSSLKLEDYIEPSIMLRTNTTDFFLMFD